MVQVLEPGYSFGSEFGKSFGGGLGLGVQKYFENKLAEEAREAQFQKQKQMEEYKSGLLGQREEAERAARFAHETTQQQKKFQHEKELEGFKGKKEITKNVNALQGAKNVLNQMKGIRATGNLGVGASYSPFASTRKLAGEYSQLGKSLIQYATNIPIRNQLEFETLAHELYDPDITDARAAGVLNAMERIINNSLSEYEQGEERPSSSVTRLENTFYQKPGGKEKPPLSSFHKKK